MKNLLTYLLVFLNVIHVESLIENITYRTKSILTIVNITLQQIQKGRTDKTLKMFTIRNFHIQYKVHLYVTNINITNKTCN